MIASSTARLAVISLEGAGYHDTVATVTLNFARCLSAYLNYELLVIDADCIEHELNRMGHETDPSSAAIPFHNGAYKLDKLSRLANDADSDGRFENLVNNLVRVLKHKLGGVKYILTSNIQSAPLNVSLSIALHRVVLDTDAHVLLWAHDIWPDAIDREIALIERPAVKEEIENVFRCSWPQTTYMATSKILKSGLRKYLLIESSRCTVLPPAIDMLEVYRFTDATRRFLQKINILEADCILYMPARLSNRKDIPFALRVMRCIADAFPNSKLIITGSSSNDLKNSDLVLGDLRHSIEEYRLGGNVVILASEVFDERKVPRDDVIALYGLADLVLCSSVHEGFFLPALEANCFNTSVFAPAIDTLISWSTGEVTFYEKYDGPFCVARSILEDIRVKASIERRKRMRGYHLPSIVEKFEKILGDSWDEIPDVVCKKGN